MSTAAYNALLDAYLRADQFPRALKVFEQMREIGVKADVHTYNLIMEGYLWRKDVEGADAVFRLMNKDGMRRHLMRYGGL